MAQSIPKDFDLLKANLDPIALPVYFWNILPYVEWFHYNGLRYCYWQGRWRVVNWKALPGPQPDLIPFVDYDPESE